MARSRTVSTADVLRALPYRSPVKGWHAHGQHLVPTDGCAACAELRRREEVGHDESTRRPSSGEGRRVLRGAGD